MISKTCPHCTQALSLSANERTKTSLKEGDISVCNYCGGFMKFSAELELLKLNPFEFSALVPEIQIDFFEARTQILLRNNRQSKFKFPQP